MTYEMFKEAVIAAAKKLGIKEYELYYSSSEGTSAEVFKHEIKSFSSSVFGGACFRCLVDGKMGYASTEELSEEQAESVVKRAFENAGVLETDEKQFLVSGGQEYEPLDIKPYALPTTDELIKTALAGQEAVYAADPSVIDGTEAGAESTVARMAIFNSNGLDLKYENNIAIYYASAVVSDGKEMSDDFANKAGSFDALDVKQIAEKAVSGAKAMQNADVAPTGSYPVVFSPKAMANMLSAFSGIFSSENAQKGLSLLKGREGEKIAADIVTLVDDPFNPESAMPINFDAEGSPTRKKNVIDKGILTTLLYNLKTAAIGGVKTTGNASKAWYSSNIGIRPFTFSISAGDITEEELLEKAGSGVYINDVSGLHAGADPVSGDFSLQSSGFMIEDGRKTTPVKSFTVAGNFYDLLKNITAVASNAELRNPFGITAFGSPSVLVTGLTVAGK